MGLLSFLVGLPLAPLRGVIRLAEILRDQAEQELYSPKSAQRQLQEIEEARAAGQISEEAASEAMRQILDRTIRRPRQSS